MQPVTIVLPAAPLRTWVSGYWFVRDDTGAHASHPVHTSPLPFAVLSVNFGIPNRSDDGAPVPRASLLGVQARVRRWDPSAQTFFVMAMLTLPGLARLFPHAGASAGALLELGAVLGDRDAGALADSLASADSIACALDRWLLARADAIDPPHRHAELAHAHSLLRDGHGVDAAARAVGVDRRQLGRWFERHLGVAPRTVIELERLHASLVATQRRCGDARQGFADQAHQIRSWQRRLRTTPGAYARGGGSVLARTVVGQDALAPAFYL